MSLSMYQASVPVLVRALNNLGAVLGKAEAHAEERGIAPEILLQARLFPDMLALTRQVQIATDMAKNAVSRLAGADLVPFADDETSFAQLRDRIARAIAHVEGFDAAAIDGSETRAIHLKTGGREVQLDGQSYLLQFVLPNVFFHSTVAYALLREAGVVLGKNDFLGPVTA